MNLHRLTYGQAYRNLFKKSLNFEFLKLGKRFLIEKVFWKTCEPKSASQIFY